MSNREINEKEYARIYAAGEYNVGSVHDHIIRIRQRYLRDVSGRALDHGFANGIVSQYLQEEGFDAYGVETASATFDLIRRRVAAGARLKLDQFRLLNSGTTTLPFPDGFFSAIISNQVLYYIAERNAIDATVREFFRTLAPGGKVACTVMAEDNYLFTRCGVPPVPDVGPIHVQVSGRIRRDWMLYRFRNAADLRQSFESAGFVVDDLGYFDFQLLDVNCAKHHIVLARKPE